MKLTNEDILVASLLGSKALEQVPRFQEVEDYLSYKIGSAIPFLPINNKEDNEKTNKRFNKNEQFFPFTFANGEESQWYTLPWEPMIDIKSKNIITKRYVAKQGKMNIGSVKERWANDDYDITITGTLFGLKDQGELSETYPKTDMEKLRNYLLSAESIKVNCEPLQILGINRIVIESMNFPFTKGESVQAYEINAVSDFDFELLIENTNVSA